MFISHTENLIIINPPKTGTNSALRLMEMLGIKNDCNPSPSPLRGRFYQHETMQSAKNRLAKIGIDARDYWTTSRARNPWMLYASRTAWAMSLFSRYRHLAYTGLKRPEATAVTKLAELRKRIGANPTDWLDHFVSSSPPLDTWWRGRDGSIIIDDIGTTEQIESWAHKVARRVNKSMQMNLSAPHLNKSPGYDYKAMYTPCLVGLVANKEQWTIDKFGYTFD